MSFLAGKTEDRTRTVVHTAHLLLKDRFEEINTGKTFGSFTLVREAPGVDLTGRTYTNMEGKSILTAVMLGRLWPELTQKMKDLEDTQQQADLPNPADQPAGFRLSLHWPMWPADEKLDGIAGSALAKQANVIGDLAFMQLMYTHKGAAKEHRNLVEQSKSAASKEKELPPSGVDEMEIDPTVAQDVDELAGTAGAGVTGEPEQDLAATALPPAFKVDKAFRFSRDWPLWPSAGVLSNDVINAAQVQNALIADTLFESIKVKTARQAAAGSKKIFGPVDPEARALASSESARVVYIPLLKDWLAFGGTLYTNASNPAKAEALKFRQYLIDDKTDADVEFQDEDDMTQNMLAQLNSFDEGGVGQFYVHASKAYNKLVDEDGEADDDTDREESLADDASLAFSTKSTRELEDGGRGVRRSGRRGRATSKPTLSKRKVVDSDDEEEDDAEDDAGEDDDESSARGARGRAAKKAKLTATTKKATKKTTKK